MDLLAEAYYAGHIAHYDGYSLKLNPHKRHSELWEQWCMGYFDEKNDLVLYEKHCKNCKNIKK